MRVTAITPARLRCPSAGLSWMRTFLTQQTAFFDETMADALAQTGIDTSHLPFVTVDFNRES